MKWFRFGREAFIALLLACSFEVLARLGASVFFSGPSETPTTLYGLWALVFIVGVAVFLKKRWAILPTQFAGMLLVCSLICGVTYTIFTQVVVSDPVTLLGARYAGVQEPAGFGHVYTVDDPMLKAEMVIKDAIHGNSAARPWSFLFWQTAMAAGFNPSTLPGNTLGKAPPSLWYRVELATTVGPVAIVEACIRGIVFHLPVLLAGLGLWHVFSRMPLFGEIENAEA